MFSFGATPNKPAKSVDLTTAFSRLIRLVPEVTEAERVAIKALIEVRNSELHSDEDAFRNTKHGTIIPNILSFFVRITDTIEFDLDQLLTSSDAEQARTTFKALSKNRSERIRSLIRTQKDRFFEKNDEEQKTA